MFNKYMLLPVRISILASIVSAFCSGCVPPRTTSSYRPTPQPPQVINWKDYSKVVDHGEFGLSELEIVATGEHAVRISGQADAISYKVETGQNYYRKGRRAMTKRATGRWVTNPNGTRSWKTTHAQYGYVGGGTEYRNQQVLNRQWTPTQLELSNPFGANIKVPVQADGSFSAVIELDDKYFTGRIPRSKIPSKYFGSYHYRKNKSFVIRPSKPPFRVKALEEPFKVRYVSFDQDEVDEYIRSIKTNITLSVKDRVTHLPLSPTIKITRGNGTSNEEIENRLIKEFGDRTLASEEMKKIRSSLFFRGAEDKTTTGQSIGFDAFVGATYKIETTHGQYHYFRTFFVPKQSGKIKKNVLLIEKGQKIRVEGVKEGEGGILVDQ